MRRVALAAVALAALLLPAAAQAAEWGLIQPGVSTTQTVRARYGAPSRMEKVKVDKYDTDRWVFEGDKAPSGIVRMTVEFGFLHDNKYRPEVVRVLQLEPHGATFNRGIIGNGWGFPDGSGKNGEEEFFVYKDGLLVYFNPDGWTVRMMLFTVPQPRDPTEERR